MKRLSQKARIIKITGGHEILLPVSGIRVFRLTAIRLYTELYTRGTIQSKGCLSPGFRKLGCTGRADEDR